MFNFRNGFFLLLGFSAGYYKGIQHGTKFKEIYEELRNDENFQEIVEELKRSVKNAQEATEDRPDDVEGTATDVGQNVFNPEADISTERANEILNATIASPVTLTKDEIASIDPQYFETNHRSGAFKLDGVSPALETRDTPT